MKSYHLWVHWKQGDDLHHHLKDQDPVSALRGWSESLAAGADRVAQLATFLEGKVIEIEAGTHHIGFHGDPAILDDAVAQGLIQVDYDGEPEQQEAVEVDPHDHE